MGEVQLGAVEARFADLIWEAAPVTTGTLVAQCAEVFGWKRTTTYTVLRRLCEKGLFQTENGTVTVKLPRADFYARASRDYVETRFGGSLPAFIAAFAGGKGMSEKEIAEIEALIDAYKKGET